MMATNIRDYIKVYDDFLDKQFCKKVLNELKKINWETHTFVDYNGNRMSHNNELSVSFDKIEVQEELTKKLWYAVERYILKDFKKRWFYNWNGYTSVRFNKYDKHTEMKEHCDHIHSIFDGDIRGIPILSIVGCLNDDYKGGEFIMWQTEKIDIPAGAVLIFPSNFMYPHKVNLVTKGTRYSYVSWVY